MSEPRNIKVDIQYQGTNILNAISPYLERFSYSDVASNESDSITIELHNIDKKWFTTWFPENGDKIKASLSFLNWSTADTKKTLSCGIFYVDDLTFSGRPLRCTIEAAAIPQTEAIHSRNRTKTWKKVTIQEIATEIANRAGIELYYDAKSIAIDSIEQDEETDSRFLSELCKDYGLAMKLYANKIVIFEEEVYAKKTPVLELSETDLLAWSYNTTVAGTYTGAKVSFTDPKNSKDHTVIIGNGKRRLELNVTADSIKDAELKGTARLANENKKRKTMNLTIMARPELTAASCITITGIGKLSGIYYIDKIKTTISGKSASQMSLSTHKVSDLIQSDSAKATKAAAERRTETTHTVISGDNLWNLAKKYLGSGARYLEIYYENQNIIETAAKRHGKSSSNRGQWIFPGTTLTIPVR